MNTKNKYLLGSIIFLLCVGVGFFITKALSGNFRSNETKKEPEIIGKVPTGNNISGGREKIVIPIDPDTQKVDPPVTQEPVEPMKIASTDVQIIGDAYSLQIICTNVPVNVTLEYEIPDLQKKNSDGFFTRIPGRKSGSYKVNVRNSATGEVLASKVVSGFKIIDVKPVELMSAGEFQTLLLNQNDNSLLGGKHPKVSKSIALSFEGLHDDEKKPGDILSVREKIAYGIWSSAKVLRVGYDEKGRINSAKIQPVY